MTNLEAPQEPLIIPPAIELTEQSDQAPDVDALAEMNLGAIEDTEPTVVATANTARRIPKGAFAALAAVTVLLAGCGPSGEAAPTAPAVAASSTVGATAPSAAESSAPTSSPERDPVKSGDWSKLTPEQQAEFSALDAIQWGDMNPEEFSTIWSDNYGPADQPYETRPIVQFGLYLYENNVAATLEQVKLQIPRLADKIEAATHITQASSGQAKLFHQQLIIAVAHHVGQTDKNAGALIMAIAVDPSLEAYSHEMADYFNSTFETPYKMVIDTAEVEPEVIQNHTGSGADDPTSGVEGYGDIVPGVRNGHEWRNYTSDYIFDPVSGAREYNLTLQAQQPK